MHNSVVVTTVIALLATSCMKKGAGPDSDEPRASQQQCDYAGVHVKGLKVGKALSDDEQATWRKNPEYATFMDKCVTFSSMSVQCLIDAQTKEAISSCK